MFLSNLACFFNADFFFLACRYFPPVFPLTFNMPENSKSFENLHHKLFKCRHLEITSYTKPKGPHLFCKPAWIWYYFFKHMFHSWMDRIQYYLYFVANALNARITWQLKWAVVRVFLVLVACYSFLFISVYLIKTNLSCVFFFHISPYFYLCVFFWWENQELEKILSDTPPVWRGSSKLFRNLRDRGQYTCTQQKDTLPCFSDCGLLQLKNNMHYLSFKFNIILFN